MSKGENRLLRGKRGVSPVIATVILVAVTIVVAIAVAYWMGGIAALYTRSEKLEISSAYAVKGATTYNGTSGWDVTINLKNTGSADATIDYILINGKPMSQFTGNAKVVTSLPVSIISGAEASISLQLKEGSSFSSGTTIEIRIHSAAGYEYPKPISLP